MIDRQNVYYFIGLALLCGMVVYSAHTLLKRHGGVDLPPIPTPRKPDPVGETIKKRGPFDTTEKKMKNAREDQGEKQAPGDMRNPFLWVGELEPKVEVKVEAAPITPPRLGMIIVGPEARLAFLDGKPVYQGREHGRFRVVRILPDRVILSVDRERIELIAPKTYSGGVEMKREERKTLEKG